MWCVGSRVLGARATHSDFAGERPNERLLSVVRLDARLLLVELYGLVAEERDELYDPL